MLSSLGTRDIAGATYHLTNKGLVDAGRMIELAASEFSGIELGAHGGPDLAQPIGFVFTSHRSGAPVRPEPLATAKQVASKPFRSVVSIGVERDGFVSIGDGQWVDRTMVRVIRTQPVPAAVAPNARWIDVDLDEQTVVAYAGARPMFATLASTGRRTGTTPVGVFRVRAKAATMRMAGPPDTRESYDVGEIPWAVRLKKGIFFHASYWHDGFGGVRSHGCVNLSPKDARFIYDWVDPTVPPGWSEIEVERTAGTIVRIRDAAHPDPAQYAYADETDETDQTDETDEADDARSIEVNPSVIRR
jgi:lipoprotein-anchoring transpeptidase ErfK/SrfK